MYRKIKEKLSLFTIKHPRTALILGIILMNIILLLISGLIINLLMRKTFPDAGFWETIYWTIAMIFDAGMIEGVVGFDITQTSLILIIVCLATIIIGNITFTGAIIGYVTNYISGFIDNVNSNSRKIRTSGHTVILNWNSRASEIINDMLYLGKKATVIVLVNQNMEVVKQEINERLYLTIRSERMKNKLNIFVREGSTYSTKQLYDISLHRAKTVIILTDDDTNYYCKYDLAERQTINKGNAGTIKTLVQVAQITSADNSADDQKIVVEVGDEWTSSLVNRIIHHKEKLAKCNIVPVPVNKILGQLLSQFCIFPELNSVYSELFSNRGAEFFCKKSVGIIGEEEEESALRELLMTNSTIVPLAFLDAKSGKQLYYMGDREEDINRHTGRAETNISVRLNREFWLEKRNVIILGHNSKVREIMEGFNSFLNEWSRPDGAAMLNLMVIDDEKSLERQNYYRDYPYVNETVSADIYDTETIKNTINRFIDSNKEDTSILVLSDDQVQEKDMDTYALTYLIHVQDIIFDRVEKDPNYDTDRIDVIVEIMNPKNYDVVHNYNIDNIVISNRYISKMVTQIGEKIELFEFYSDILTYDDATEDEGEYESKEVYIKPVAQFFSEYPEKADCRDLVRAVYEASPKNNRSFLLGVTHPNGGLELFSGEQSGRQVTLTDEDRLILYSKH